MHYSSYSQLYIKSKKKLCQISKSSLNNSFDSMQSINQKFDELNLSIDTTNSEVKKEKLYITKSKSFIKSRKSVDTNESTFIEFREESSIYGSKEENGVVQDFLKGVSKFFSCL